MNRRLTKIALTAGLAAIGSLSLAASASANLATVGSALTLPFDGGVCTVNCVTVQQSQQGGSSPNPLTSPANGVVVRWAVRTSDDGALYLLRILRPAGTDTYTGVGTVAASSAVPSGTDDAILTYPASVAIKAGDSIGLQLGGASDEGIPQNTTNGIPSNVFANNFSGQPVDGTSATFLPAQQHELLLQATVAFCSVPNVHKLKKVAAKQALAAADCGVKVKKKETNKKKFRGKVLKQKKPPGTTAAPGTVVPIVIGKKN